MNKEENKWYNSATVLDTLTFLFPPLGIYGLFKNQTIQSLLKKVLLAVLGLLSFLLLLSYIW